jgi:hypothetical protein
MGLFFKKKKAEEAIPVTENKPEVSMSEEKKAAEPVAKPALSNEVPAEIVAVIAAAIAYTLGSGVKVLSVRRAEKRKERSSWGMAGLLDNTRPF